MDLETSPAPVWGAAWVYKRDGRLVPFESDRISQSLFAASESLGRPDAFLARELTDAILHFLALELEGAIPTTAQIADLAGKVVREMGQPALGQAYADMASQRTRDQHPLPNKTGTKEEVVFRFSLQDNPDTVVGSCLRAFSLGAIFSRELAAAQADGLVTLVGLDAPMQLASCLLDLPPRVREGLDLHEALFALRNTPGRLTVLDGLEYILSPNEPIEVQRTDVWVRALVRGAFTAGQTAIVNLNAAVPPPWAEHLVQGPLFAGSGGSSLLPEQRTGRAIHLLEGLLASRVLHNGGRVDWHLAETDFVPAAAAPLGRVARMALEYSALAFTFDRPRREVSLADGLDRHHPGVLQTVGLHLPRLAELAQVACNPELFLQKLRSLARLALSAGAQKREFLRRRQTEDSRLQRGFLLERARLVVVPVGLAAVARLLTGSEICDDRQTQELARKIVLRLREVLRQDGPGYQLDACLDGAENFFLGSAKPAPGPSANAVAVAGLTAWDATASWRHQLRAAGPLHAAAGAGTAAVILPADPPLSVEEFASILRYAWEETEIVRLRLVRFGPTERQLW